MSDFERRILKDRRQTQTPLVSKYSFWGLRRNFRRKEDRIKGGYVDRYSSGIFFFLVTIVGLNIIDALLTIVILDFGGREANPVVHSVMVMYGDKFWVWKFFVVSFCLIMLCLHSKFRMVKALILSITAVYTGIISYQMILIFKHFIPIKILSLKPF
ncbi:MAG: DUF5658 family protein [Thermodesulfobacteriota bacterium]